MLVEQTARRAISVERLVHWHKVCRLLSLWASSYFLMRFFFFVGANLISLIDFGRPDTDYSHMIQAFHRFLLDQLCSEGNAFPHNPRVVPVKLGSSSTDSLAAAPITQLLGIIAKNVIKCSNCAAVREKENMTHVVDLVYPRKVR